MPASLHFLANGNPAEDGHAGVVNIDSNHSGHLPVNDQHQRVMALREFVRTIFIIDVEAATILEQDLAANIVISLPFLLRFRRSQGMRVAHDQSSAMSAHLS